MVNLLGSALKLHFLLYGSQWIRTYVSTNRLFVYTGLGKACFPPRENFLAMRDSSKIPMRISFSLSRVNEVRMRNVEKFCLVENRLNSELFCVCYQDPFLFTYQSALNCIYTDLGLVQTPGTDSKKTLRKRGMGNCP